jgi:hypothetical protein
MSFSITKGLSFSIAKGAGERRLRVSNADVRTSLVLLELDDLYTGVGTEILLDPKEADRLARYLMKQAWK